MKEINLEQILLIEIRKSTALNEKRIDVPIINAMREACNQAIELCAEEARLKFDDAGRMRVCESSILKCKEAIK